ncbi:MAG: hypothetical protein P4L83_15380 [Nevskia sp.]|nr:hypothetical protein [Nevskia sp.]
MQPKHLGALALALALPACGSGNYSGASEEAGLTQSTGVTGTGSGSSSGASCMAPSGPQTVSAAGRAHSLALSSPAADSAAQAYFNANVEPNVQSGNCSVCHVAGGLANQSGYAIPNQLTLSSDRTQDYANFLAAYNNLPQPADVTQNDLLVYPAGGSGHPGGQMWPGGGTAYTAMQTVLQEWAADAAAGSSSSSGGGSSGGSSSGGGSSSSGGTGCPTGSSSSSGGTVTSGSSSSGGIVASGSSSSSSSSGGGSGGTSTYPLLGDLQATGGGSFARDFCASQPDSAALPIDPRTLWTAANVGGSYVVQFSYPWHIEHTPALFATQARQNALRAAQGKTPIYSAKPRPTTCGEWRMAVANGYQFFAYGTSEAAFLPRSLFYSLVQKYATSEQVPFSWSQDPATVNATVASVLQNRYGLIPATFRNPFPLPGEDPNQTNGGSLQLPAGITQDKDASGKYAGTIALHCGICHAGQIGNGTNNVGTIDAEGDNPTGSYYGLTNTNVDIGLLLNDLPRSADVNNNNGAHIWQAQPGYFLNSTRGTTDVQFGVAQIFVNRDVDTLNLRVGPDEALLVPAFLTPEVSLVLGDSVAPPWWWLHNVGYSFPFIC